jgi:hypothetical protein
MKSGRDASLLGLSSFVSRLIRTARVPVQERILGAIEFANTEIFKLLRGGGGTTLSAVIVDRRGAVVMGHVGDSRVYSVQGGDPHQISKDDTLDAVLKKKLDSQNESPRDNRLLQFVGMGNDLEPHVATISPTGADYFLLTSDGAHDVPQHMFHRVVRSARQNNDLARKLIQLSEVLGGLDNATVAVMPSSFDVGGGRPPEGLDLTLISPGGRLDIWIPQLNDDKREGSLDRRANVLQSKAIGTSEDLQESPETPPILPSEQQNPVKDKLADKPKRVRKKPQKRKTDNSENDQLPLPAPSIEIKFPEQDDGNK